PPPQPSIDAHLSIVQAGPAQSAGWTGSGVRIGVVDSGVNREHPALNGRVLANYTYVDPRVNNVNVDDVVGHGTVVAQLAGIADRDQAEALRGFSVQAPRGSFPAPEEDEYYWV
ncbi:S8 family serine peptidase, partial [Acinetobacter baumannii]|uniref:S8 family serine peptidase n=1 Tax=Acinetobacter baumannii TaxID=470 RepID=UPI00331BF61D